MTLSKKIHKLLEFFNKHSRDKDIQDDYDTKFMIYILNSLPYSLYRHDVDLERKLIKDLLKNEQLNGELREELSIRYGILTKQLKDSEHCGFKYINLNRRDKYDWI